MRKAMGEQAVALARAVDYHSAGTVELIVSGADTTGQGFYFLEMNTRLQVEHPVTEYITGLDLVEQMIRVAYGEKLAFTQADIGINGWSVENRVYAEDPYRGFLPSTGRLVRYRPPPESETVRVDDGVYEGSDISIFYDPMIAKLVTWGATREKAIDAQVAALDRFEIEGIGHNVDFLSALMQHPRFRSGAITTGFIAEEYPDGFQGAPTPEKLTERLAAIAAIAGSAEAARAAEIDQRLNGAITSNAEWVVTMDGAEHHVLIAGETVTVDGHPMTIEAPYVPGQKLIEARIGEEELSVKVDRTRSGWTFTTRGKTHKLRVLPPHVAELARHMIEKIPPDMSRFLLCPMPGLVTRIDVTAGDKVEAGQPLAVVEAMKMENILRAEKAGTVKSVEAVAGESLAVDAVILEFE
jgi:propionyl-CoA carboxylase alpha chain